MPRGRPRDPLNSWMPPLVKKDYRGYYFRNATTGEYAVLAPPEATKAEVWFAYEKLGKGSAGTVNALLDAYFRSPQYQRLKPQTRTDYEQYAVRVRQVFGEMHPDHITPPHVQRFVDAVGVDTPTAANRAKALLSLTLNWGKGRGYTRIENPCSDITDIRTASVARYIEDAEYLDFYQFLGLHQHPMHQAAMEIAYLCGSRQQDVLRIRMSRPRNPDPEDCYIETDGLMIWQAKTGKVQLKLWSDSLRAAVDLAIAHRAKKAGDFLIHGRTGEPFTRGGFNATWIRMQAEALRTKVLGRRFRFHDLKHKGVSDAPGDKQFFSGHTSKAMVERYNHTADRVPAINRPNLLEKQRVGTQIDT